MSRIIKFLEYIGHDHKPGDVPSKIHCPFHYDTRESAKVYPQSDTIHCFTCNKTWTIYTAYMTKFNKRYLDAVRAVDTLWPLEPNLSLDIMTLNPKDFEKITDDDLKKFVEILSLRISKLSDSRRYPSVLKAASSKISKDNLEALDLLLLIERHLNEEKS